MPKQWLLPLALAVAAPCSLFAADPPPIALDSPHFHLVTTAGEKQARQLLDNFEHMRRVFQTLFPQDNSDPPTPILVLAARNEKEFDALEPSSYLAKGQINLAGYFLASQDKNFILVRLDAQFDHPYAAVFHEYTHLQFRNTQEWMPLWLSEGIAEFFQNTEFRQKQVLLGEPSSQNILYLRQNALIPLSALFRINRTSPYYHAENKGSIFYAESWALTHYLEITDGRNGENGQSRLSDYMLRLSRQEDPVAAAEAAFGDLKKLQSELERYIRQPQYQHLVLNRIPADSNPASYTVRTLTQPEFNAHRAEFLAHVGRTDEALALLASVLQADPSNAQSCETMGYLAVHAGYQNAARDWYAKAVALGSRSFLAHYNYAVFTLESGQKDSALEDSNRVESAHSIETSLRTAITLNPGFAPAYDLLAQLYAAQPDMAAEARKLQFQAIQLDGDNLSYRLHASSLLEAQGKYHEAVRALEAARPLARGESAAAMLASRIREIGQLRTTHEEGADILARFGKSTTVEGKTGIPATPGQSAAASRYPAGPATGRRHQVSGSIRSIRCDTGNSLEITLQVAARPRPLLLYTNDRVNMDLTAFGFTPPAEVDPCTGLKNYRAQVMYAESPDKTVDGQIIAVMLRKQPSRK
jgi:tetratricopeptide (TPR) repeat protein